jgi:hypothetical protein
VVSGPRMVSAPPTARPMRISHELIAGLPQTAGPMRSAPNRLPFAMRTQSAATRMQGCHGAGSSDELARLACFEQPQASAHPIDGGCGFCQSDGTLTRGIRVIRVRRAVSDDAARFSMGVSQPALRPRSNSGCDPPPAPPGRTRTDAMHYVARTPHPSRARWREAVSSQHRADHHPR